MYNFPAFCFAHVLCKLYPQSIHCLLQYFPRHFNWLLHDNVFPCFLGKIISLLQIIFKLWSFFWLFLRQELVLNQIFLQLFQQFWITVLHSQLGWFCWSVVCFVQCYPLIRYPLILCCHFIFLLIYFIDRSDYTENKNMTSKLQIEMNVIKLNWRCYERFNNEDFSLRWVQINWTQQILWLHGKIVEVNY